MYKNYAWLIIVQLAATAADLYACGSISGRSMMIPVIFIAFVLWREVWRKNDKK